MRNLSILDVSADTHYIVLGISETATQVEIKRAYRRLIRRVHPDKFPDALPSRKLVIEQNSRTVIEAYYVLSDPARRSFYDEQLARFRQRHAPASRAVATPNAAPSSSPSSYPSPPNRRRLRIDERGQKWALWAILLILVAALSLLSSLAYVGSTYTDVNPAAEYVNESPIQSSQTGQTSPRTWKEDLEIDDYCHQHPNGIYDHPGKGREHCSLWLFLRKLSGVRDKGLKPAEKSTKTKPVEPQ